MNWYKNAQIEITSEDFAVIKGIVSKIMDGNKEWSSEELQLQTNYSELIEKLLMERAV